MAKREKNQKKEIELLAPAGSYETFEAVIRAGADAVYLGGAQFGARAFAGNLGEEELLSAIDYAHVHGRQVYLTVNTLLKEDEFQGQLYEYLLPYYRQGLDAVILQDLGAFSLIKREFPELEIHTSTQMTVAGSMGAAYMKKLGASRIVTAREMSLEEIREIHEHVDIEIESFVHGALCYCYSGQCLLSSMLGGRSGNRGRCAQPCRLPYEVFDKNRNSVQVKGNFVLSPKDLCTIDGIPALAENGIYSLKIEGRMKQAEYAAGVVSIYRGYIDGYLADLNQARRSGMCEAEARALAKERYRVSREDMQKLLDMGNRSGFTDGYYERHNGAEMITFGKANHARTNESLQREIREKYVHPAGQESQIKEKINGILKLKKDFPATIELSCGKYHILESGETVQPALKQPLSLEKVEGNIRKTGNTPFVFEELIIDMDTDIFMPVQALNQLRRTALASLFERMTEGHRRARQNGKKTREGVQGYPGATKHQPKVVLDGGALLIVSIEERAQLAEVLHAEYVDAVYLDSSCYERDTLPQCLRDDVAAVRRSRKDVFFILPAVFRKQTVDFYRGIQAELLAAGLDGVVAKSLDAVAFAREYLDGELDIVLDHSLYTWNREAMALLLELHPLRDTVPLELNRREIGGRYNCSSEMLIYGRLPLMTSAQCVHANTGSCDRRKTVLYLKDRYGKYFPVKNHCCECYNTIYNTTPLMLFGYGEELRGMGMAGYRIAFTLEDKMEVRRILQICKDTFLTGERKIRDLFAEDYTNGHYKRGVE